jgi:hypothetical protein
VITLKKDVIGIACAVLGLTNLGFNAASNILLRNEAKKNTRALMGIYATLTFLAVGVSAAHTKSIIEAIRKEALEGPYK